MTQFAYADPPYLGCCSYYSHAHPAGDRPFDGRCWNDIETHRLLIDWLSDEYPDGWALSASAPSLRDILPLTPSDVRIAPWVKTFCAFKRNVRPAYAWEPVIFRSHSNPPHRPHAPPSGRRQADHTEGLLRRAHHAKKGADRLEVTRVLRVGAVVAQRSARQHRARLVPGRRRHGDGVRGGRLT